MFENTALFRRPLIRRRLVSFSLVAGLALLMATLASAATPPFELAYDQATPATEIYRTIADQGRLTVLFEPGLPNRSITLTLAAPSARRALELVGRTAGHFVVDLDDTTVMMVNDTPNRRRAHAQPALETFELEHGRLEDIATALRTVLGSEALIIDRVRKAISLYDAPERLALARQIVAAHDRAPGHVDVTIELLHFDRNHLAAAVAALNEDQAMSPTHLDASQAQRLRLADGANLLARTHLSLRDGAGAELAFLDRVSTTAGGGEPYVHPVGLELDLRGRIHHQHATVTLQLDLKGHLLRTGADAGPVYGQRQMTSEAQFGHGDALLIRGLFELTGGRPAALESALSPLGAILANGSARPSEVVLLVSPRIRPAASPAWVTLRPGSTDQRTSIRFPLGPDDTPVNLDETTVERLRQRLRSLPRGHVPALDPLHTRTPSRATPP